MTHEDPERREMPATLVERLRSTDVDVVLVAALEAANELERRQGRVLVARDPTEAMLKAGGDMWYALLHRHPTTNEDCAAYIYAAMLTAAPEDRNE